MPMVVFLDTQGQRRPVTMQAGASVMQTAIDHGIPGIIGECGGSAMCGTCHVYVEESFVPRLPPVGSVENEMLEAVASERRPNSRLGCQIILTSELDGIVLEIAASQR